jgi:hypothetical protein
MAALVTSVRSLEDNLGLMADFLETDHRYTTPKASQSCRYITDEDKSSKGCGVHRGRLRKMPGERANQTQHLGGHYTVDHWTMDC